MKLIIDIDEDVYNEIKSIVRKPESLYPLDVSIRNGTPLPKGHGDLIDRDETMGTWSNKYFYQGVPLENYIDEVPAVIPADEEDKE